jgi:protein-disulfide isomerase
MSQLKVPVTSRDHIRGSDGAGVTLVEYGDYQCPYCAMANPIVGQMGRQYGPKLRVVFRHFPMNEVHPLALPAAEAAEYASDNGVFWEMHDAIYANQPRLGVSLLFAIAGTLRLSQIGLRDSLANLAHSDGIRSDFLGGVRSGVNGTPTFFINSVRHDGGFSAPELSAAIDHNLAATH